MERMRNFVEHKAVFFKVNCLSIGKFVDGSIGMYVSRRSVWGSVWGLLGSIGNL